MRWALLLAVALLAGCALPLHLEVNGKLVYVDPDAPRDIPSDIYTKGEVVLELGRGHLHPYADAQVTVEVVGSHLPISSRTAFNGGFNATIDLPNRPMGPTIVSFLVEVSRNSTLLRRSFEVRLGGQTDVRLDDVVIVIDDKLLAPNEPETLAHREPKPQPPSPRAEVPKPESRPEEVPPPPEEPRPEPKPEEMPPPPPEEPRPEPKPEEKPPISEEPRPDRPRSVAPPDLALANPRLLDSSDAPVAAMGAAKKARLRVQVSNKGNGAASYARLKVEAPRDLAVNDLSLGEIAPGSERDVTVDLTASRELGDGTATLLLRLTEERGFDARPLKVIIPTRRLRLPAWTLTTSLQDKNGLARGNGNGSFESGEKVELTLTVRNGGEAASACKVTLASNGLTIEPKTIELPEIEPGSSREAVFAVSASRVFSGPAKLDATLADPDELAKKTSTIDLPFATRWSKLAIEASAPPLTRGSAVDITATVVEKGGLEAEGVTLAARATKPGIDVSPASVTLGTIADRSRPATFRVSVRRGAELGSAKLVLTAKQDDFPQEEIELALAVQDEEAATASVGEAPTNRPKAHARPLVTLATRGQRTSADVIRIVGAAADEESISAIVLTRNGKLVEGLRDIGGTRASPTEKRPRVEIDATVPLEPGTNRIVVIARSSSGIESVPCEVVIERAEEKGRTFALVVGIGRYKSSDVQALRYAEADALSFKEYLVGSKLVPNEAVTFLVGEQATKKALLKGLDGLRKRAGADDRIILFSAGHGLSGDARGAGGEPERYLAPWDVDPAPDELLASAVPMDEVSRILGNSGARETVSFVDACYSGAIGLRSGSAPSEESQRSFLAGRGRVVLASSARSQPSREEERLGHGLFTAVLLEALEQSSKDVLDTDELFRFVRDEVQKRSDGAQRPVYKADIDAPIRFPVWRR